MKKSVTDVSTREQAMTVKDETVMISHRMPVEILAALDTLAARLDRPRSRLLNEACRDLLRKHEAVIVESRSETDEADARAAA
jgi:predicted transcriptional regulator